MWQASGDRRIPVATTTFRRVRDIKQTAGSTAGGALRPQLHELAMQARSDQLLGLQHHRVLCPHAGYSAAVRAGQPGGQVEGFRTAVDTLHAAGLEVLLDVVFNHTAEAGADGPTLCHRGLDNAAYYRLDPADP